MSEEADATEEEFEEDVENTIPELSIADDNAGVRVPPPVIYGTCFILAVIFELFYGADLFTWGAQFAIGLILMSTGTVLIVWCAIMFIDADTQLPPYRPTKVIVKNGPYALSRNPIYLGMSIFYIGAIVLFDVIWGYIFFVPLILIMQKYVITKEEAYLSMKFCNEYTDYKDSVRRWLYTPYLLLHNSY